MVKVSRAPGTKGRGREQRRGRGEGDHCEMLADDARLKKKDTPRWRKYWRENIGVHGGAVHTYTHKMAVDEQEFQQRVVNEHPQG
jgi:hypothetical protein